MNQEYLPLIVALATSAVLAWPIYRLLLYLKSRQTISQFVPEHAGKQGTPTMGGLIIVVGFMAAAFLLEKRFSDPSFLILLAGFSAIGFVDDFVVPRVLKGKRGLGWGQKLLLEIAAAALAIWQGPSSGALEMMVAGFLILFFANAYNFADGLDWLAGSLLFAILAALVPLSMWSGQGVVLHHLLVLGVAAVPFMVMNRPPAKIFMGDVGSLAIGAVLGLVVFRLGAAIPATSQIAMWSALALASVMMVAELVPVPLQILSVKLRKGKRLFLMTPIHHGYQKRGWKESRIVLAFFLVQLACSGAALILYRLGQQQ